MVQPDLSFCCCLFVKRSYTPLERENSDLQDGATRFVILLLVVHKIKLYTMGKENLHPQDDIVFMCIQCAKKLLHCLQLLTFFAYSSATKAPKILQFISKMPIYPVYKPATYLSNPSIFHQVR